MCNIVCVNCKTIINYTEIWNTVTGIKMVQKTRAHVSVTVL